MELTPSFFTYFPQANWENAARASLRDCSELTME
jgi:hypothetical protein